jgi:hypothetical protein
MTLSGVTPCIVTVRSIRSISLIDYGYVGMYFSDRIMIGMIALIYVLLSDTNSLVFPFVCLCLFVFDGRLEETA